MGVKKILVSKKFTPPPRHVRRPGGEDPHRRQRKFRNSFLKKGKVLRIAWNGKNIDQKSVRIPGARTPSAPADIFHIYLVLIIEEMTKFPKNSIISPVIPNIEGLEYPSSL